jgi:hypothetical protein
MLTYLNAAGPCWVAFLIAGYQCPDDGFNGAPFVLGVGAGH